MTPAVTPAVNPAAPLIEQIRVRLQSLSPLSIELDDESAFHAGHPGAAAGGGHYRLAIFSAAFTGRSKVERHRLVYAALGDLMRGPVHALALTALAPGEAAPASASAPLPPP